MLKRGIESGGILVSKANRHASALLSSKLFRRGIIYTLSSVINSLTNLLLLPILTKYLTPADYGIIETFLSLVAVLVCIIVFGSNTTLSKEFFCLDSRSRAVYIGNALFMIGIVGATLLFMTLIIVLPGGVSAAWLHVQGIVILTAVIVSIGRAVFTIAQTVLQLERKPFQYAVFVNGNTLVELTLSVVLIVMMGLQWRGRLLGILITQMTSMVFAVMWLRKSGLLTFRPFTHLAKIASSAPPLVLAQLAGWGVSLADRIIVIHLMNAANVGLYSLGSRFAMVIMMLGTSFSIAWAPFFYDTLRSGDLRGNVRIVYATYIYGTAMVAISIVYGICAHWVIHFIVDPRFFKASDFVLLLSLAYCADGIWKMFVGYLIFHGRFVAYSTIACAAAVLNVTLDFVFVRQWGAIGAAWAALVAIGLGMLVTLIMAVRIHPMPWFSFLGMNQAEVPAID